jgi:hypothetical protein
MSEIEARTRTVYFAPSVGRHYLTKKAAANREAGARMSAKYPSESALSIDGRQVDNGWHWSEDERLRRVRDRLARWILRNFNRGAPAP